MTHRFLSALMVSVAAAAVLSSPVLAQEATPYQQPPAPIAEILDSQPTPTASLSPDRATLALFDRSNLPPIAELAEPMLRLGGYRINPRNNGPANSRVSWLTGLSFQSIETGTIQRVALPQGTRYTSPAWSPDGRSMAFLRDAPDGLELWVADRVGAQARRLADVHVNATTGRAFDWAPDGRSLVVQLVPADRGPVPDVTRPPEGPIVAESMGRAAPVRTYQDLLSNAGDEALFDYYFTAQLARISVDGAVQPLGEPAVYLSASLSPDGDHVLTSTVQRPYSHIVPASLFPSTIEVIDRAGQPVYRVADLPLRDNIPTPFDAVAPGRRSVQWRADAPATLTWVEAQDGGDPRDAAPVRDRVSMLAAPFTGSAVTLIDLPERYSGITWGNDNVALVNSRWFNTRHETRYVVSPSQPGQGRIVLERNYQDRYNNPGSPVTEPNGNGFSVIRFDRSGRILMSGPGATREGEYPFLAAMDLTTGQTERLWTSAPGEYETIVGILDEDARTLVTRRETRNDPPNLMIRYLDGQANTPLTQFPDPAPQLAGVTRELITYARADGVQLSGTLYLPAGYDRTRDGPLPLVMWAYPAEFTDASVAGQVVDTANRFVRPGGSSHLFLLTQGYAVLDDPSMPIIGQAGAEPNDTYIAQLTADAQAAVDAVVALGVADRDRIAVGGHSYGAFMTANLLAHTDLFRTGIARSGAYNRTLTPFGFQSEQRTYWEATDTYTEMSPFTFANRINEPILLIHGEADDNSGTFPVQSERFYAALKGNGGSVRYVVLPLEAHGYRARESVGHTLWEMVRWLDTYVKTAPPRQP
jgi:Dipeptidyl aminopeptidases/acylaminoacyl-peptidases